MFLGRKRPHNSNSITQTAIVDTKSQLKEKRSKEVMDIFMQQTELTPIENNLPTATVRHDADMSSYNTSTLFKHTEDIQLIWSLAIALTQPDQAVSVKKWMRNLVQPGLENQLKRSQELHVNDPFITTFVNLTFGQTDAASESAQAQNDFNLAMYIIHSETKDTTQVVQQQISDFKANGQWQTMTVFHKKCWYAVAGDLGYVAADGFAVTERVYWQCALGMYIWFGNRHGSFDLSRYNKALDTRTGSNINQLKTAKHTAVPDDRCLWYQLLQWWIGNESVANIAEWPLDLVWLLTIYKQPNTIDEKYALNWIEYLETQDMAELAIYATLFLKRPAEKLNHILRECEWNNEAKLINSYHIPSKQVYIAKALNAHDSWDYQREFECLIQGGLKEQAKMALLHFLLPKTYDGNETALRASIDFLSDIPDPDDDIKTLLNTYKALLTKENMEHAGQYIKELQQLQSKYKSTHLHALLQALIEALKDHM
ncbi:hypothetical protein HMPREF1544_11132 [Mucor circinelloides 1006PhL]|uniref:Nuclear pore complex protein NUP96 C-terminal domain-containing protein n=1 Tax=Mucor circinelloides f. circinelloides (strain 1006PhL) TaxID=1220926 RepID=S2JHZ2_MUCC1|nr:hypothetical protein HMPREF1544_11132 [Mucor circinelloides 1006PhL]